MRYLYVLLLLLFLIPAVTATNLIFPSPLISDTDSIEFTVVGKDIVNQIQTEESILSISYEQSSKTGRITPTPDNPGIFVSNMTVVFPNYNVTTPVRLVREPVLEVSKGPYHEYTSPAKIKYFATEGLGTCYSGNTQFVPEQGSHTLQASLENKTTCTTILGKRTYSTPTTIQRHDTLPFTAYLEKIHFEKGTLIVNNQHATALHLRMELNQTTPVYTAPETITIPAKETAYIPIYQTEPTTRELTESATITLNAKDHSKTLPFTIRLQTQKQESGIISYQKKHPYRKYLLWTIISSAVLLIILLLTQSFRARHVSRKYIPTKDETAIRQTRPSTKKNLKQLSDMLDEIGDNK